MLTQEQIDIIIKVMMPYNPKKIGIFGSYARGENTEGSDIDILYSFEEPINLFEKVDILDELKEQLNKEVDLVSEKYIHPYLKETIFKDLRLIYEN